MSMSDKPRLYINIFLGDLSQVGGCSPSQLAIGRDIIGRTKVCNLKSSQKGKQEGVEALKEYLPVTGKPQNP